MLRLDLLALDLTRRRSSRPLRAVALEIGISAATLLRIESGKGPDLESFAKLCRWLGTNPNRYLGLTVSFNRTEKAFLGAIERYVGSP
jgi:transcriptional regulator with XRE-family HTH domain